MKLDHTVKTKAHIGKELNKPTEEEILFMANLVKENIQQSIQKEGI